MTQPNSEPVTLIENPAAFYARMQVEEPAMGKAVAESDWQTTDRLFAEAIAARHRECPVHHRMASGKGAVGVYTCAADDVVAGTFTLLNQTVHLGESFDWNTVVGMGDREFIWLLNRFAFLDELWDAYKETGDKKCLDRAVFLMNDWIEKNPASAAKDLWGAWRTLEIGLRIPVWCRTVGRLADEGVVPRETIRRFSASLWEQTNYLVAHTGPYRGNWGLMENIGIAIYATSFPMIRESEAWLSFALANHRADARKQIYADGSQEELTPHYALTCLHCFREMSDLMRRCSGQATPDLDEVVERMSVYAGAIVKPDGTIPMINDSDAANISGFLFDAVRRFGREDLRFIATRGEDGEEPERESRFLSDSGLAVMRRGWDKNALYLCCDAGPFGTAHQHEDSLCIDVMAYGQRMISDPGRYLYHREAIMGYLRQTRAHNTITVDDGNQRRREIRESWLPGGMPEPTWHSETAFDYLEAEYPFGYTAENAHNVKHRRQIVFHRGRGYWLINDSILGEGTHTFRLSYQFAPGELRTINNNTLVFQGEKGGMTLIVLGPTSIEPRIAVGEKDPPTGWYSEIYGIALPAPYVEFVSDETLPAQWQTILIPFPGDEIPKAGAEVKSIDPLTVAVTINAEADDVTLDRKKPQGATVICRKDWRTVFEW